MPWLGCSVTLHFARLMGGRFGFKNVKCWRYTVRGTGVRWAGVKAQNIAIWRTKSYKKKVVNEWIYHIEGGVYQSPLGFTSMQLLDEILSLKILFPSLTAHANSLCKSLDYGTNRLVYETKYFQAIQCELFFKENHGSWCCTFYILYSIFKIIRNLTRNLITTNLYLLSVLAVHRIIP